MARANSTFTGRRVAAIFGRVTEEMAAQEAALDHLQGASDAPDTRQGA